MPRKSYALNELREAVLQMCSRDGGDHRANACCQPVIIFGAYDDQCLRRRTSIRQGAHKWTRLRIDSGNDWRLRRYERLVEESQSYL